MSNKYGAKRVVFDGYTFDSQAEHRRYLQLKQLESAGEIRRLEVHPVYVLVKAFRDNEGKHQSAIRYIADFRYLEGEQSVVEDVKGVVTSTFALKAKLFKRAYFNTKLRIIKV
jgi:hypothetical protein